MFIEAAILGIIIGIIRRGRIARLAYVEFNMAPLIYVPLILYFGIVVMNLGLFDYNSSLYSAFIIGSYVLTAVFLIANIDKKFMTIPLLGLSSNLACFIVNGFHFPISAQYVAKYYGSSALELLTSGKIKYFIPDEGAVSVSYTHLTLPTT